MPEKKRKYMVNPATRMIYGDTISNLPDGSEFTVSTPIEMIRDNRPFAVPVRTRTKGPRRGDKYPVKIPLRGGLSSIVTQDRLDSDARSRSYHPGAKTELGNLMTYRIRPLKRLNATTALPYQPFFRRFGILYSDGTAPTDHYTEIFVDWDENGTVQEIWGTRNSGYPFETGWANAYARLLYKRGEGVSPELP